MKKIIAMLLAAMMLLSLAACAKKPDSNDGQPDTNVGDTNDTDNTNDSTDTNDGAAEGGEDDSTADDPAQGEGAPDGEVEGDVAVLDPEEGVLAQPGEGPAAGGMPSLGGGEAVEGETPAQTLLAVFKNLVASDSSLTAYDIAEILATDPVIAFAGGAMEIEPGFLTGFGNAEITGFKEGAVFMPIIGSIPFVGYVFQLEEGADVDAFIKTLEDNANLRWNICVEADEMVTGSEGTFVFFCMSPISFE